MDRDKLVAWVASNLLPQEGAVRHWLARTLASHWDIDDVIQEVYCRVWRIEAIEAIAHPRAYFFQMARNIVVDEMRRAKVVRFTHLAEVEESRLTSLAPTPEQSAWSREELRHVLAMMDRLPPRCRAIFTMRKVEGLSLREIAGRMGLSQTVIQNEVSRALKRLLKIIEEAERPASPTRALAKRWSRRG
jgi:RNA polymerase sigma factor (sigma-70 family)